MFPLLFSCRIEASEKKFVQMCAHEIHNCPVLVAFLTPKFKFFNDFQRHFVSIAYHVFKSGGKIGLPKSIDTTEMKHVQNVLDLCAESTATKKKCRVELMFLGLNLKLL